MIPGAFCLLFFFVLGSWRRKAGRESRGGRGRVGRLSSSVYIV